MLKTKDCAKIEKWTNADYVLNVLVYLINAVIISALFVLFIYLNGKSGGMTLDEFFRNANKPVQFTVLLLLTLGITATYFYFEDRNYMRDAVNSEMLFLIIEVSLLACYFTNRYLSIYLRPFTLAPLLILFLTNKRSAIFVSAVFSIIVFLMDMYAGLLSGIQLYCALIVGFSSGIIAVFTLGKVYSRIKLLLVSFSMSAPYFISTLMIMFETNFNDWLKSIICSIASGPFSAALFIILLPIFELIFKKVSCFKLAELTDHRARLIKRLIKEAPGTFNHSIVLSNIAEACATAIGEDALLARTCAYYHDIGKLRRPEFFGENQNDKEDMHKDLTPELSANIIRSHTQDGYNLILKSGLPQEIADVALQHHGTMPIWYFYDKAKKFTEGEVDINEFSYSGPKPQTKIAAIIMIADGCEAAARSIKDRSREKVTDVVTKIVSDRMEIGQFDECEITIKEINIIIETVVNNLTGVYHQRVKYPKVSLKGIKESTKDEN